MAGRAVINQLSQLDGAQNSDFFYPNVDFESKYGTDF